VHRHVKIVVVGGVARPQSYEHIGPLADASLAQTNLDVMFLGVVDLDLEHGATAAHEGEASVDRQLAGRAGRVVVPTDHSKLGRSALARICSIDEVDVLLTDRPAQARRAAGRRGLLTSGRVSRRPECGGPVNKAQGAGLWVAVTSGSGL